MKRFVSSIALVWFCAVGAGARADVPPSDVEFCSGKPTTTACQNEDGKAGHCGDGTCSRARPEGSSTYACYRCIEGAPPAAAEKGACEGGSDAAGGLGLAAALVALASRRARAGS